MKYIVFDIDGVLADCSHRLHYIQGDDKDYDKFYSDEEILKDKVLKSGKTLFNAIERSISEDCRNKHYYNEIGEFSKVRIVFITGRNESCYTATEKWLWDNIINTAVSIYMRPENDYRPAHEVKKDLIEKHIGFENILFAFDDDNQVDEMYKKHGVMCYKPNTTKE